MNKKLFALLVTLILWGSGFAGVRAGLRGYSPEHLVALRFAIASLVLVGYAYLTRMRLPQVKDLPAIALGGFLGIRINFSDRLFRHFSRCDRLYDLDLHPIANFCRQSR
ncbi:EamA family transporter [Chroococcidiopsis thermalis]|uniref:EamA family transporter n=1 Tax=Chroococcidiopsis thermalis TaxID=54299 RepID=UPI0003084BA0|nr:EamA family transporter [Chroococcidiopsis thermalis]